MKGAINIFLNKFATSFILSCLLLSLVKICLASVPVTEEVWEEVKNKDGVTIFVGEGKKDSIVAVKAHVVIDAGIERVKAVLDDENRHVEWVPYLKESSVLKTFSPTESLHYNKFDAPWPAANRDFVYRMTVVDNDHPGITYIMKSEDSPLMPKQERTVRAVLMKSTYKLIPLSEEQTQVEFLFHADPKGWLPLWIANIIQKGFPFMVLKGLREQVRAIDK